MSQSIQSFEDIKQLLSADIDLTNQLIIKELQSDVALINQLGLYIINSGGKRLRPLLVLLCSNALEYRGSDHHTLAAVIEFIHTATLLHDDVVDDSDLRRGNETANALFGNEASVLTGDFLYSRAFQMMVKVSSMPVMDLLANTTNLIAEGEVLQLMNCNEPDLTEDDYYEVIRRKTAILFAAACELGAILSGQSKLRQAFRDYGMNLGMAFQVVDDVLDYVSSAEEMGKNVGDDLSEGKPTLPLIIALQRASKTEQALIQSAIINSDASEIDEIISIIHSTEALEYCDDIAKQFTDAAIQSIEFLTESPFKSALLTLANLALSRKN